MTELIKQQSYEYEYIRKKGAMAADVEFLRHDSETGTILNLFLGQNVMLTCYFAMLIPLST